MNNLLLWSVFMNPALGQPRLRATTTPIMRWIFALLSLPAFAATLDSRIHDAIAPFKGTVSLYAKNLDTGQTYGIREDERVRTASTIKLPIMAALFAEVAAGRVKWTDELVLHDSDKVSGSGILHEFSDGVRLPIRDVMHLMIVLSDNTATNLILDRITADTVNAFMDKLGLPRTRSMRKVRGDGKELKPAEGWSAAGRLPENQRFGLGSSTPKEMVTLLEKIEKGEVVSPAASKEMIAVLKRQQDQSGIRRKLQHMPIANKTGSLDALRSDVGIVYSPKGRIAMAITCDDMPQIDYGPDNPGAILISDLAQILVESLTAPAPPH
jgi:beta-lactamase class A